MALDLAGTLPVSVLNVGLAATPPGLQAQIALLEGELVKLQGSLAAEAALTVSPPSLGLAAAAAAMLTPPTIVQALGNVLTASATLNLEAVAELGLVELQLAAVGELSGRLQAGLDAGGLAAWTYRGHARGHGERLRAATSRGFGDVGPEQPISALILATESFSAWGNFGASFNVGDTVKRKEITGPTTTEERLVFLGALTGGQLNTGLAEFALPIDLFRLQLEGAKLNLQAQIDVSLGLNLPSIEALLAIDVDLEVALNAFVSVDLAVAAQIELTLGKIEALLKLIGDISVRLSGGGLSLWVYSGTAAGLGQAFASAMAGGMPGGSGPLAPVYGITIATAIPSAWADFGLIFKTAA